MSHNSSVESGFTRTRVSVAQKPATTKAKATQRLDTIGEATAWSPCYICFDRGIVESYSSLVVVRLLMHKIWMWENEMADEDRAEAESEAGLQSPPSQNDPDERILHEIELLPCHYFNFFYGISGGGLVATLLGRLRLRVGDAVDQFQNITQAMSRHRRHGSFSGVVMPIYPSRYLVNAVHDAVMKHSIKTPECGGTDELFRTPSAVLSPTWEDPMQAQTCILVCGDIGGDISRQHSLRTFKTGSGYDKQVDPLDLPLAADQLDLTICQVLRAATARPRYFSPLETSIGSKTAKLFDASNAISNPTGIAIRDHNSSHRNSVSSEQKTLPAAEFTSPIDIKGSTADDRTLFLSIGWYEVVDKQDREFHKFGHVLPDAVPIDGHYDLESDFSDSMDSMYIQGTGYSYVRLRPDLRINGDFKQGPRINASSFGKIRDSTTDAVNNDEKLKRELRRAAKELVRRRRARQKMGGPRWEVFVGNTVKTDGDGKERS
jgi:hypothetical protein